MTGLQGQQSAALGKGSWASAWQSRGLPEAQGKAYQELGTEDLCPRSSREGCVLEKKARKAYWRTKVHCRGNSWLRIGGWGSASWSCLLLTEHMGKVQTSCVTHTHSLPQTSSLGPKNGGDRVRGEAWMELNQIQKNAANPTTVHLVHTPVGAQRVYVCWYKCKFLSSQQTVFPFNITSKLVKITIFLHPINQIFFVITKAIRANCRNFWKSRKWGRKILSAYNLTAGRYSLLTFKRLPSCLCLCNFQSFRLFKNILD